jgi:hypothetical protein
MKYISHLRTILTYILWIILIKWDSSDLFVFRLHLWILNMLLTTFYSENFMKYVYPFSGQNTEYFNVRAGGIYSYQYSLKG